MVLYVSHINKVSRFIRSGILKSHIQLISQRVNLSLQFYVCKARRPDSFISLYSLHVPLTKHNREKTESSGNFGGMSMIKVAAKLALLPPATSTRMFHPG